MEALRGTVMLTVRDLERSTAFYRDKLGFTELPSPILPLLTLGGLRLYLVDESPPTEDKPGVTMRGSEGVRSRLRCELRQSSPGKRDYFAKVWVLRRRSAPLTAYAVANGAGQRPSPSGEADERFDPEPEG